MEPVNLDQLGRKLRVMIAAIDAGQLTPDPLELLWAADVCKQHGELTIARELQRIARRLLPNLSRDLA